MPSNEPTSGWNLPPGCFESDIDRAFGGDDAPTCGDCSHCLEGCCDFGICELEFGEAFDATGDETATPWKAACWARDWIVEHYKDMQEDTCERCDG